MRNPVSALARRVWIATARRAAIRPKSPDPKEIVKGLLRGLQLSGLDGRGALDDALAAKDWERAANLLETKPDRTPGDENDLGCALAHVATGEEEAWTDAVAALERCLEAIEENGQDRELRARASSNLEIVQRARRVAGA